MIMKNSKMRRLDDEVVRRGIYPTIETARAAIMAGDVLVNQQVAYKADHKVNEQSLLEIKKRFPYSSRGAVKIEKAIKDFSLILTGMKVVDIGISTGGFSDFILKHGADCVLGIDVNISQVDFQLRKNQRLALLQKNARYLEESDIPFLPDLITIDVSFISVLKILPPLRIFPKTRVLALIKPQFEAKPADVGAKGIIQEISTIRQVIISTKEQIEKMNFGIMAFTLAGIKGRKGNQEYFFLLQYGKRSMVSDKIIDHEIKI